MNMDKQLRDFLRSEIECRFSEQDIIDHFGTNVVNMLLKRRLIKQYQNSKDEYRYRLTHKGKRLSGKNLLRPLTITEATKRIAEIRKRARAINADPTLLYGIRTITLFGSCLKMKSKVGDIDLAVAIRQKNNWTSEAHRELAHAWSQRTRQPPINWSAEDEIRKLLRARDPYISIGSDSIFIERENEFHPRMVIYRHRADAFRFHKAKPTLPVVCAFCGSKAESEGIDVMIKAIRFFGKGLRRRKNEFHNAVICNLCVDACAQLVEKRRAKRNDERKRNERGSATISRSTARFQISTTGEAAALRHHT